MSLCEVCIKSRPAGRDGLDCRIYGKISSVQNTAGKDKKWETKQMQ